MIESWTGALQGALITFIDKIVAVIPNIIGAALVLVIGSLIAMGLGEIVGTIIEKFKVDQALEKTVLKPVSENLGVKINVAKMFEEMVKWFILIIVFIAAADIADLHQVNDFLNQVLLYLPNVFVAIIILLVATVLASFVTNMITSLGQDDMGYIRGLAKGAIYVFAVLSALHQLQISQPLIEILFTGIVATCVLAFGIGGKDVAGEILKKAYDDFGKRKK